MKKRKQPKPVDRYDLPDRRAAEGAIARMHRLLESRAFESIDEMNEFLSRATAEGLEPRPPETPAERAQEVMYEAWGERGERRVELARSALELDPDCADAYVLLAEETATTPEEAEPLYRQGVEAGERALGRELFEEAEGRFWSVLETRPYMRAREGLAQVLWARGELEAAATELDAMLRLNPGDNQGARYSLAHILLALNDGGRLRDLLDRYPDDGSAAWAYDRAFVLFRTEGESLAARVALAAAFQTNRYVAVYLGGLERPPSRVSDYVTPGGADEAASYVYSSARAWIDTPGVLEWFAQVLARTMARDTGRPQPPETVEDIVEDLEARSPAFPHAALEAAVARREEVTPYLLDILERSPAETVRRGYSGYLSAMYLLAQFRERRAYPLLVRLLADATDEVLDTILGDVLTEDMQRILGSVAGGDPAPLRRLVEDTNADQYVRGAAIDGILASIVVGELARDEAVVTLRALLGAELGTGNDDDDDAGAYVRAEVVCAACDLGAAELLPEIERAFADELVDETVIDLPLARTLMAERAALADPLLEDRDRYLPVDDAIAMLERWVGDDPDALPEHPHGARRTHASKGKSKTKRKSKSKASKASRKRNRR